MSRSEIVDKSSDIYPPKPYPIGAKLKRIRNGRNGNYSVGDVGLLERYDRFDLSCPLNPSWEVYLSGCKEVHDLSNYKLVEDEPKKEFKVGKWYKTQPEIWDSHKLTQEKYYRIIEVSCGWIRVINDSGMLNGYNDYHLDVNSECDSDPNTYQDTEIYTGKVLGSGDIRWSEPVPYTIRGQGSIRSIKIEGVVNLNKTKEESNMTIQRKVVNVKLIDDDAGLPVDLALVYDFGDHVVEDSEEVVIREIIMTHELREILDSHNDNRTGQVNIELQQRTGNTVNLLPVVLKQLRWVIK